MLHDQRHLGEREEDGDRHGAPDLESDPEIRREGSARSPRLSTARNRKNTPQRIVSFRHPSSSSLKAAWEDVAEQRFAEEEAAEQDRAEERVDDGRLHLDEGVVLQPERQRAEDEDDDAGDDGIIGSVRS